MADGIRTHEGCEGDRCFGCVDKTKQVCCGECLPSSSGQSGKCTRPSTAESRANVDEDTMQVDEYQGHYECEEMERLLGYAAMAEQAIHMKEQQAAPPAFGCPDLRRAECE
eukprot:FR737174.1.p2 GENE.FR737174.1~~FR737174.1.p2  ORF type:complete len:111 (+),score=9.55 FR737174.1:253-585(+)